MIWKSQQQKHEQLWHNNHNKKYHKYLSHMSETSCPQTKPSKYSCRKKSKSHSTECFYFESQNPVFLFTRPSRINFVNHSETLFRKLESLDAQTNAFIYWVPTVNCHTCNTSRSAATLWRHQLILPINILILILKVVWNLQNIMGSPL